MVHFASTAERVQYILDASQAEAYKLLSEAEQQVEEWTTIAIQEGHQQGKAQVENLTQALEQWQMHLSQNLKKEMLELTFSTAKELLTQHISHEQRALCIAKNGLAQVKDAQQLKIYANAADLPHLETHKNQLLAVLNNAQKLQICADPALAAGDIIIQTEAGTLNAHLETQLQKLAKIARNAGSATW